MKHLKVAMTVLVITLAMVLPTHSIAADQTLKIGLAMPFAGPLGVWGQAAGNGLRLVAEEYNTAGGIEVAGRKYKIEFVEADTAFSVEGMANAARRLIEKNQVHFIYGGLAGFLTRAMQEVTEPAKVLTLTGGYTKAAINKSLGKSDYSFRAIPAYSEMLPAGLKWLQKNHPEIKRVALFEANVDSAVAGQRLFNEIAPHVGLEVVYDDHFELSDTDFTPYMLKILKSKPDVIYQMTGLAAPLASVVKTARQLGYKGAFMVGSIPDMETMTPIAGAKNLEGLIGIGYPLKGEFALPGTLKWVKAFQAKYSDPVDQAFWSAVAGSTLFQAIQVAGSFDSDKVKAVMEDGREWTSTMGIKGVWGNAKRYGHPHQWMTNYAVWEVKDGKATTVAPISAKDMSFDWKGKD